MTLWQTCFSSFVGEKVSVRLSREIDKRAANLNPNPNLDLALALTLTL